MKKIIISVLCSLVIAMGGFYWTVVRPAWAGVTCSLPFTLTNGTIADATQVMANYNALVTCLTNAAAAGANNDITSLSGLTTPLTPAQGGSNVYIGANPTKSVVSTATTLVISSLTPTGYANATGQSVVFVSPFTNTTTIQSVVNGQATANVFKLSSGGPIALTGGEIVTNQAYQMIFDGTQFEINPFPNVTAGFGIQSDPTTGISINLKNPPYGFGPCVNMTISATVGSNLLGLQLFAADTGVAPTNAHPILCNFRDSTIGNGDPLWKTIESSVYMDTNGAGASLGTSNGLPFRIWVVLFYNGGTPTLGLWQSTSFTPGASPQNVNISLNNLDEATLQSPTAISAAATSAGTYYAPNGSSISNSPFRILGHLDWANGLTTAGSYASGPTKIQLFGPGVRKPGDRINYFYQTATATASTTNNYVDSAIPPIPTNGGTAVSIALTPVNPMDVIRINGQAFINNGSAGQTMGAFLSNGTKTLAVSFGGTSGVNTVPLATETLQASAIVTAASQTIGLYFTGSSGTTFLNAGSASNTVQGGVASWLSIEEIEP